MGEFTPDLGVTLAIAIIAAIGANIIGPVIRSLLGRRSEDASITETWVTSFKALQESVNSIQEQLDEERDKRRELEQHVDALERKLDVAFYTIRGLVTQVKELGGTPIVPVEIQKEIVKLNGWDGE